VLRAAQSGSNFVQLQVREVQGAEAALMEDLSVPACPSEPPRDAGLSKAEDPRGGGSIQPFSQRREHHGDLVRGGFQAIQGRVASGTEGAVAGRTSEGLDALSRAMLAISDERMDLRISIAEVRALRVGTGEALGVDSLRCSSAAFDLTPGPHRSMR
jgi:hypothetical protein